MTDAQTEARAVARSASPTVRKLFDAIRESGSSEPDIADAAGVSHATLHYWRAGKRSPTIMLLEAVASVLGYNIELVKTDHATALAAKDAELEKVKAECDKWREAFGEMHRQTMRAEARLAEANKALDAAGDFIDRVSGAALGIAMSGDNHPNPDEVLMDFSREGMALSSSIRAARRALEAQGGENG